MTPTQREALTKAEATFRRYGDLHAAKPDPVKAAANYEMADRMAAALAEFEDPVQADAVDLLFALQDAWPYVHQWCTIESKKNKIVALLRKHGEFADLWKDKLQGPDYKQAFDVWQDKTEWVQETAAPHELGMHRADVLRQRIEALKQPRKVVKLTQQELDSIAEDCRNQFRDYVRGRRKEEPVKLDRAVEAASLAKNGLTG